MDRHIKIYPSKVRFILAFFISALFLTACLNQSADNRRTDNHKLNSQRNTLPEQNRGTSVYVIKVKDGDSLILRGKNQKEFEARLFGIDAPELSQPFGKEAKRNLSQLALKQEFQVTSKGFDRYQRAIVILSKKDRDRVIDINLNQTMISNGNAWVYRQYQPDPEWIKLEAEAKKNKKGLWKLPRPLAPWEWRRKK